jgi:hypothetical protein
VIRADRRGTGLADGLGLPSAGERTGEGTVRRFEEHTTIQVPADRIYADVSDMTAHGDWAGDGLERIEVRMEGTDPVAS